MLEKDFEFYITNKNNLVDSYEGKFLVIENQSILNASPTLQDAFSFINSNYNSGAFLIQHCLDKIDSQTTAVSL